jgi:hypothetical protein
LKELAEAATIIVPAQVQESAAQSTLALLPRTNPAPEVATTSMLDGSKSTSFSKKYNKINTITMSKKTLYLHLSVSDGT